MLYVIGIGPGNPEYMTEEARRALAGCDLIVGYPLYLEFVKKQFPEKEYYATPMTREIERCRYALAQARSRRVALVCSGDAGVYGMAGPVLELAPEYPETEIQVISGVTAALGGAAVLGAPLMHDFAVISLSDRLTPMEEIRRKLKNAAESGFVIALYNPSSKKRHDYLRMACEILLTCLPPATVCGYVRNVGRNEPEGGILSLEELKTFEADMFTTIFIGNDRTKAVGGRMVTPRGYGEKIRNSGILSKMKGGEREDDSSERTGDREKADEGILVAAGTTEGRKLCEYFAAHKQTVYAFVATEYGEEMLPADPCIRIRTGRRDADEMYEFLKTHRIHTCYDAMHPYATLAHKNMKEACARSGCVYTRVLRETESDGRTVTDEESGTYAPGLRETENVNGRIRTLGEAVTYEEKREELIRVSSIREAADFLKNQTGNILVTTGSRELAPFAELEHFEERIWVRVLPSIESLEVCHKAGFHGKQILAMHGPFSKEMNELLLREHRIRWLVTKDSGKAGGFQEKLEAAEAVGAQVILVERPKETEGIPLKELILQLEKGR